MHNPVCLSMEPEKAVLQFAVFFREDVGDLPQLISHAKVQVDAYTTWENVSTMLAPQLPSSTFIVGYKPNMGLNSAGLDPDISTFARGLAIKAEKKNSLPFAIATLVDGVHFKDYMEHIVVVEPLNKDTYVPANNVSVTLVPRGGHFVPGYTPTMIVKKTTKASKVWFYIDILVPGTVELLYKEQIFTAPVTIVRGQDLPSALKEGKARKDAVAVVPNVEVKVTTMRYSLGGRSLGLTKRPKSKGRSKSRSRGNRSGSRRRSRSRGSRARVRRS